MTIPASLLLKARDPYIELVFPLNGIELSCPFDMQPQRTTPIANNVRGLEPLTQRDRGAQRPGLSRYLGQIPTAGKVQFLGFIVDPQADALIADTDEEDPNVGPSFFYITDPSTNNRKTRNPGPRRVRRGGSGRQSNINIGKQSVIITWPNPADIVVGTALSGTQLNATAATSLAFPVPGTFVYSPVAGAVLAKGDDQALNTIFTPTDANLYRMAAKTVFINVVQNKIDTYVDAPGTDTKLVSTQSLGDQNFEAVGRAVGGGGLVPGTMVYSPALGTTPSEPSITITMTFTPDDLASYNASELTRAYEVDPDHPDVPALQIKVTDIGGDFGPGNVAVLEVPGPPINSDDDLTTASDLAGLPAIVYFVSLTHLADGSYIGASWNWDEMRWEAT